MRKLLLATLTLLAMSTAGHAAVIADLGINPNSAQGAFANQVGGTTFDDQYTFQLVGGPQFLTIASVTNVFPNATDFITDFTGSVFQIVGTIGGGDDIQVIGPVVAAPCPGQVNCQGFAGSAILDAGNYYLDISGTGGGTSGYGGDLAVAAVPEPSTWAMMLIGLVGLGLFGMRRSIGNPSAASRSNP